VRAVRWLLVLGSVGACAVALAGSAPSSSGAPAGRLVVLPFESKLGSSIGLELTIRSSAKAPAPANVTTYVPAGYGLKTSGAPGKTIGDAFALFVTTAKPSEPDSAFETLKSGDPASLPADPAAQACAPGPHAAFWIVKFTIKKQSLTVRFYVDPTTGPDVALGAFKVIACLASPYVPVGQGGAPGGVRFVELDLFLYDKGVSVFKSPTTAGTYLWRMLVTPYSAGTGTPDTAAMFEARARVLQPHVVSVHATYRKKTKMLLLSGRLLGLGKPRAGMVVTFWIFSGDSLYKYAKVKTRADGRYSLRKRVPERRRPRTLDLLAEINAAPGPCVDPPVATGGCVDENISPPASVYVSVRIPKLPKK
jgi:hypothetical protein